MRENRWISEQLEQLERAKRREAAALAERARQQEIAAKAAAEIAAEIAARCGVGGVAPPALALEGGNQLAMGRAATGGGARTVDITAKPAPSPPCRSPLAPLNRSGGFGAAVQEKAEGGATTTAARAGTPPSTITPARHATQREVTPAKYSQRVDRARAANKLRSAQRISLSSAKSPPESPAIHPLGLATPPGLTPPAECLVSPRC